MDPTRCEDLRSAIFAGDAERGVSAARLLLAAGQAPLEVFSGCIQPALVEVGERFSRLELFLPELMGAAAVVNAIQEVLLPQMQGDASQATSGRIVIATVSGDLHDIGKNIVKTLLQVNGFQVRDLGVDVAAERIIRAAEDFKADIVALSALMLPSLPYARDVIELLQGSERYRGRFKVMVGGGCVSREWARQAGADGYGDDAVEAVQVAQALMDKAGVPP